MHRSGNDRATRAGKLEEARRDSYRWLRELRQCTKDRLLAPNAYVLYLNFSEVRTVLTIYVKSA
jgi:hypothetical protein